MVQGILVILLVISFAMITQQFNETIYRIGFLLLIALSNNVNLQKKLLIC